MDKNQIVSWKNDLEAHLTEELLPFWIERCWDDEHGGFLTQFDEKGKLTDCDEKSLLAHMRTIFSFSLATQYGFDLEGRCSALAKKGVRFAIDNYWDSEYGGFYWLFNRKNKLICDKKIIYGQSFAMYALATYGKVFHDPEAVLYAEKCFELLMIYASETSYGGFWEMFQRDWSLCGPGAEGGNRKTLDVHMHLMEAFTALYDATGKDVHKRKLSELISLLSDKIMHPQYRTGIPQFNYRWEPTEQIKFNVIWGWDRYDKQSGAKQHTDNTSYGHNVEFFWLMSHALMVLGQTTDEHSPMFEKILGHAVNSGIDYTYGGVYVEGSADGKYVYDDAKEFWQQAEVMIGMLEAYIQYSDDTYLSVYENVHKFVMEKMINHSVGEWLALLDRKGDPIWKHMSHSWKVNYHSIRAVVLSIVKLKKIIANEKINCFDGSKK